MRGIYTALASSLALVAAAAGAHATTYNAATEFSGTQGGTSGVWQYGELVGNVFNTLPYNSGAGAYEGTDAFNTPILGLPVANTLFMHPGQFGEVTDLRFIALSAGTYTATFSAELTDSSCGACSGEDGVTAAINSTSVLVNRPGGYSYQTVTDTFTLASGGIIDFSISPNQNYNYDSTRVIASVSLVPEPAAWALMLAGFGGLGAVLRARRRATLATV